MKRTGKRTIIFENKPRVISYGSVVGKKEHEGPLSNEFDAYTTDSFFGEKSFEKAESKLQKTAVQTALDKAGLTAEDIDNIFAGDLLNQCIGSSFGLRSFGIPFIGLYGACSTMALSTGLAAVFIDSGAAEKTVSVTSSHFCSAERQYRFPLNYGSQRTPTAQWTVTGSGALILGREGGDIYINSVTFGEIEDLNIKDANNMGAAMAPAAADTIYTHLKDTGRSADFYDLIITGDLANTGSNLLLSLLNKQDVDISENHRDCGCMIFDAQTQNVKSGGSGCGCCASVFCGYFYKHLLCKKVKNILLVATGALMNPASANQGQTIPSIAHAVAIEG